MMNGFKTIGNSIEILLTRVDVLGARFTSPAHLRVGTDSVLSSATLPRLKHE